VRKFATNKGIEAKDALAEGMAEKAGEFKSKGAQIYKKV